MHQIDLESEKMVSRMEAVEEQIDAAIELFFAGRLLASITLAAAAEHVLSDLLKHAGLQTSADILRTDLEQVLMNKVQGISLHKWRHNVYDWLRHADKYPYATQDVSPYEAIMWIMCGVASFLKMKGQSTAAMQEFEKYWLANLATRT
jgi:hypothetical protein